MASLQGEVHLPGDKSISHRYAILGAMAQGKTRISNFSASQDCQATLNCVEALGVTLSRAGNRVELQSQGWTHLEKPKGILDAHNSGTTIRLVSALLASREFVSTIQGDASLNDRPMKRIIVPLTRMGAEVQARNKQYPPLTIKGAPLQAIRYRLPVASAQVKSCVLLAGLMAQGHTTVVEPIPSRDHTERALPCFGAELQKRDHELTVIGQASLRGAQMSVPGDLSAAIYFIAAAALLPGSEVTFSRVGVNSSRSAALRLLTDAGVLVERSRESEVNGEPICDLRVRYGSEVFDRFPPEIAGTWIPNLIDEIPILSILGTQLKRGLTIRGAAELRRKESDRIHSIVSNLRNLGLRVEELADGFHIPPGQSIRGGKVQTFGDHRIAMSFAIAGLISKKPVEIDQPACVAVSFPKFFESLESIGR